MEIREVAASSSRTGRNTHAETGQATAASAINGSSPSPASRAQRTRMRSRVFDRSEIVTTAPTTSLSRPTGSATTSAESSHGAHSPDGSDRAPASAAVTIRGSAGSGRRRLLVGVGWSEQHRARRVDHRDRDAVQLVVAGQLLVERLGPPGGQRGLGQRGEPADVVEPVDVSLLHLPLGHGDAERHPERRDEQHREGHQDDEQATMHGPSADQLRLVGQ